MEPLGLRGGKWKYWKGRSGINTAEASEGRNQWLFTIGLALSEVFSCELGSKILLFLRSPQGVGDVEKIRRMIKLKAKP